MSAGAWYLQHDVVHITATKDAAGRPLICRASAVEVGADGRTLTVLVPLPEGIGTLANVADNGQIALVAVRPDDYRSMQLKGKDARVVPVAPGHAALARDHRAGVLDTCERVGMPPPVTDRLWSRQFAAVAFSPDSAWDQTPGQGAGREVATP